ncbi:hypothetical protein, conserved [Angomonas deanei]|uniref:Uncharacterized protein n=1 Tax=Angomonas deanei TaxID=59799 RepID=A0A7G2CMI6_9TRYP|nr:hypothetical protein, conserved [Angomonas deanei]
MTDKPEFLKEVNDIIYAINDAQRKGEKYVVLQNYDLMTASPGVYRLAEESVAHREELAQLDEQDQQLNVINPGYLEQKLLLQMKEKRHPGSGPAVSELAKEIYDVEFRLEMAWGHCVLTTLEMSQDEEHLQGMIEAFESTFQRQSDYLRALYPPSENAVEVMRTFQMQEGRMGADVVLAALCKHPPLNTTELGVILEFLKMDGVLVTTKAAEHLEKMYVKFMKEEGVEEVFHIMLEAGLPPMSTRPFAMLFNAKKIEKVSSVLDYYELMLDYGIRPEVSSLRLLCKQCSGMEFASLHFTVIQKNPEIAGTLPASNASSNNPNNNNNNNSSADSWRKNERAYFIKRLQDAVEADPNMPLLEAMKCIHRAEVEGTSLEGDTLLLTFLLLKCCNGTTALSSLVLPFYRSQAYRPEKVRLYTEEELRSGKVHAEKQKMENANAFNFELDNAEGELLEGLEDDDLEDLPLEEQELGELEGDSRSRGSPSQGHRSSLIATAQEEAEYVLRVLAEHNSFPDNKALEVISQQLNHKSHGVGVVEQVIMGVLAAGENEKTTEALRIHLCSNYVQYLMRRNHRLKLMNFLKVVLEQFYEFVQIRGVSWSTGTYADNDKSILPLLTNMMKTHQLPWAIGLFTIGLCMSSSNKLDAAKSRLLLIQEKEYRSPAYDVVTHLDRCDWDRNKILTCPDLISEEAPREEEVFDSIYTTPSQAASSYTNQKTSEVKTLHDYMYFALRDIHVERSVLDLFKQLLLKEQEAAKQTMKEEAN